jgi:hypothetical protein
MAKPLELKEIVIIHELDISNMLEIEALRELLFENGIITDEKGDRRFLFFVDW